MQQRFFLYTVGACLMLASSALAATVTMSANIKFRAPLALTKTSDIDFGVVSAGVADTYTITPDGAVSSKGKGQTLGGGAKAGSITIAGSESQAISISTSNYGGSNGVKLQEASCSYNGSGVVSPCSMAGAKPAGKQSVLKLGAIIAVDGTQAEGVVASPSFDIVVAYQ